MLPHAQSAVTARLHFRRPAPGPILASTRFRQATRRRRASLSIATAFALLALALRVSAAEQRPFVSYDDGLYSESPHLRPGKVDLLYKHRVDQEQFNGFLWTPVFKGGGGVIAPDAGLETAYGGGFFRPLAFWRDAGDLIIGAQGVNAGTQSLFEGQGEYRFPFGLGLGGGFVSTDDARSDVIFGKATYRRTSGDWSYILELQAQENEYPRGPRGSYEQLRPGGYAALYNDRWMGVGGTDGEQWRVTGAYIAPEDWPSIRPVIEVLWVDNSIGDVEGPRVLFANASLKYDGGFLSHPARLGRAMGPQGLEFGNPLGFLTPTFNRRLEVWEEGSVANFRADRVEFASGAVQERYEGVLFPAQVQAERTIADALFVGGAWIKAPDRDTVAIVGGILAPIRFLRLSVGIEHQFEPGETSVVVGLIDRF